MMPQIKRARAYMCSPLQGGTPIPDMTSGCPTFASGEDLYTECIMPAAYRSMLDFFTDVAVQGDDFKNPTIEIYGKDPDEVEMVVGRSANAA